MPLTTVPFLVNPYDDLNKQADISLDMTANPQNYLPSLESKLAYNVGEAYNLYKGGVIDNQSILPLANLGAGIGKTLPESYLNAQIQTNQIDPNLLPYIETNTMPYYLQRQEIDVSTNPFIRTTLTKQNELTQDEPNPENTDVKGLLLPKRIGSAENEYISNQINPAALRGGSNKENNKLVIKKQSDIENLMKFVNENLEYFKTSKDFYDFLTKKGIQLYELSNKISEEELNVIKSVVNKISPDDLYKSIEKGNYKFLLSHILEKTGFEKLDANDKKFDEKFSKTIQTLNNIRDKILSTNDEKTRAELIKKARNVLVDNMAEDLSGQYQTQIEVYTPNGELVKLDRVVGEKGKMNYTLYAVYSGEVGLGDQLGNKLVSIVKSPNNIDSKRRPQIVVSNYVELPILKKYKENGKTYVIRSVALVAPEIVYAHKNEIIRGLRENGIAFMANEKGKIEVFQFTNAVLGTTPTGVGSNDNK